MLKRYLHITLGSSGVLVPCPNDRCQLKRTHDIGGATITRGRPGVSGHWATRGDGSSSGERFRGHPSAARRRQAHRPASRPSGTGRPSDTKAMKASEFFFGFCDETAQNAFSPWGESNGAPWWGFRCRFWGGGNSVILRGRVSVTIVAMKLSGLGLSCLSVWPS